MRAEYQLRGGGRRNPYARRLGRRGRDALLERYVKAEGLVRLDDDVAGAFASEEEVNEALRLVVRLRELAPRPPRKAAPATRARRRAGG